MQNIGVQSFGHMMVPVRMVTNLKEDGIIFLASRTNLHTSSFVETSVSNRMEYVDRLRKLFHSAHKGKQFTTFVPHVHCSSYAFCVLCLT